MQSILPGAQNPMTTSTVFQILALLSGCSALAFGALASYHLKAEATKEDDLRQAELSEKADRITSLQAEVISLQQEAKFELKDQRDMLTGGKSFPLITLHPVGGERLGLYNGSLWVRGKHPLREVSMRVTVNNGSSVEHFDVAASSLRAGSLTDLGRTLDLGGGDMSKVIVNVRTSALNGTFTQMFKFRRNDKGEVQNSFSVMATGIRSQVLLEVGFDESPSIGSFEELRATSYPGK